MSGDRKEIERALSVLTEPGAVVELRAPKTAKERTRSGYFSDLGKLADEATRLSGKVPAVYVTLNPVNPALLARCANKTQPFAELTTADHDIIRRRWLPLDIDPVRPAGVSASDEEHYEAQETATRIMDWLADEGWPEPVYGDSGNGAHVLYQVDLPNDEDSTDLVKRVIEGLAKTFDTPTVKVDTKVFNAARIWKLPGTLACKGENIPERPHRLAKLIQVPDSLTVVTREQLERVAAPKVPEPTRAEYPRPRERFDVEAWIAKQGLVVTRTKPWHGGTLYELAECPFDPNHKREARITQNGEGALGFSCFHNSCSGRDWRALRDLKEPGRPTPREQAPRTAAKKPEPTPQEIQARLQGYRAGALIEQVKATIAANAKRGRLGIRTGFKYLDSTIEGYQPGHLWTIVGYTSKGKTAKAVQMVVNVLELEPEATVAFFSLEMTNTGNILRLAACRCGIPALAILKGAWTPADRQGIEAAFAWLATRRLYLFDSLTTFSQISRAAKALKESVGLDLIFVDFVQNIRGRGTLFERMSGLAPQLQGLAKTLSCTVVALSQVSNEGAGNNLDFIAVKGGGDLPAAADLVLWLEREPDSKALNVVVRKNRHGPTGKKVLYFDQHFTRLAEAG